MDDLNSIFLPLAWTPSKSAMKSSPHSIASSKEQLVKSEYNPTHPIYKNDHPLT